LIFVSPSLLIEHWISLLSFLNFLAADFVAAFYVVFVAAFLADAFFALIESRALNCRPKGRDHRRKRGRSSRFLVDSRPTQGKRREGLPSASSGSVTLEASVGVAAIWPRY
jgi:hypothetical protein